MLVHNAEVTGSLKINNVLFNSGSFSGSFRGDGSQLTGVAGATTASYVEYSNVANKPALVSGSSQVTYSGLSGVPSGIVSGSSQVTYSGLTGIPAGIVSGSDQITGFGIFATTGSNQFNGSQSVTGSLTVTGQVVAQTLNVQQVTSSIVYSSGSNIFGNTLGNTQQFTGSVSVTGSLTVAGAATFNLGSGEMRLNRTGTSEFLKLNTYYLLSDGNDQLLGSVTGATSIYAGNGISPRMTITSGGNVGISTASPVSTNLTGSLTIVKSYSGDTPTSTTAQTYYTNQSSLYLFGRNSGLSIISNNNEEGAIIFGNASTVAYASIKTGTAATSVGGDMYFQVGSNTERMRITSTGNVGIGTASPNANLDIQRVAGDSNDILRLGSNQNYYFGFSRNTSNGALQIQGNQTGYNNISLAPTSGNVGIGTASPGSKLDVYGSTSNGTLASSIRISGYNGEYNNSPFASLDFYNVNNTIGSAVTARILAETSSPNATGGQLTFSTTTGGNPAGSLTERMRITSGGSYQINYNPGGGDIYFRDTTAGAVMFYIIPATYVGTAPFNSNKILAANSSHISFETGGSPRMTILSGGNVLIGTTTDNGNKLQVGGNVYLTDGGNQHLKIQSSTGSYSYIFLKGGSNDGYLLQNFNGLTDNGVSAGAMYLYMSNSQQFEFNWAGVSKIQFTSTGAATFASGVETQFGGGYKFWNDAQSRWWLMYTYAAASNQLRFNYFGNDVGSINPSSGAYTALSDINKKKDFEYSNIGLNAVMGLKPTFYRMKDDESEGDKELGFIAQEVKEFIPQAYVENGEDAAKFIGLNYNAIVAALVKAIQELNEKIDKLNK